MKTEKALKAIREVFDDISASQAEIIEDLEMLTQEIEMMLDTLQGEPQGRENV